MRKAREIESSKTSSLNVELLKRTFDLAIEGDQLIRSNNLDLRQVGELLNQGWHFKKGLSKKVSNSNLDDLYNLIIKGGAFGAKLCGAGGGGFFLVIASHNAIKKIKSTLYTRMIKEIFLIKVLYI